MSVIFYGTTFRTSQRYVSLAGVILQDFALAADRILEAGQTQYHPSVAAAVDEIGPSNTVAKSSKNNQDHAHHHLMSNSFAFIISV